MRLSKFCLALLVLLFTAVPSHASTRAENKTTLIPAERLRADFAILKRAYEELHPGLYRYNTKAQMEAHFRALEAELSRDLTLRQAYAAISVFLSKVRCGHTYANFFNQPDAVADALFKGQDKMPFYFRWLGRRMVVTRNFSDDARLTPGTEVLAINDVPAEKILERLLTVARADGSNDAKRINYLEVLGESDYEAFDVYYPMFFPVERGRFELKVKGPFTRAPQTLSVRALSYEERLAPVKAAVENRRNGSGQVWDYKFLNTRTAYLRMPTWALFNSKWDWKQFLNDFFDRLAREKTPNLVIDLRGNEGGLSVGDVILSRLIKRDLRLDGFKRLVRYQRVPEDLKPYLSTWDKSFFDWGASAVEPADGFYRLTKYDDDKSGNFIKASDRPFMGRTFVIIDASNSSATFEFAQALQRNKLATLVGQPTGGNQRGINGGAFFFLRLPNSQIEVDLPLIGLFPPGMPPDAGLRPDVPVEPRAGDIARGIDTELRAVEVFLRGRR